MTDQQFDRDSWQTPKYVFNWLDKRFNFDLDGAADETNKLCDRYCFDDGDGGFLSFDPRQVDVGEYQSAFYPKSIFVNALTGALPLGRSRAIRSYYIVRIWSNWSVVSSSTGFLRRLTGSNPNKLDILIITFSASAFAESAGLRDCVPCELTILKPFFFKSAIDARQIE